MPLPRLTPRARSALIGASLLITLSACERPATQAPPAPVEVAPESAVAEPRPNDIVLLHGGIIHTVDSGQPLASAMAFYRSGEILAVGDDAALLAAFPDATQRDLAGRTVIPGLIDSHGHLHNFAESLTRAQLMGTQSKEEVVQRLREHEQSLGANDWLLGRGWDQNDWPVQEFPSAADLDQAFPDRPVLLERIDGHAAWANSAAMAMADRDLSGDWQVEGGLIYRDAAGQPTGIFIDKAALLLEQIVPATSDATMMEALDLAQDELLRLGLTGVHDPGLGRVAMDRFQRKLAQGQLRTRLYAMTDGAGETLDWLCANGPLEDPDGFLFMRATKLYGDGALGSRGAALLEDYSDDPGNRGLLFLQAQEMQAQVDKVLACGFQVAVHAIGDRGNRVVLDAMAAAMAAHPDNPGRHRVEHAQLVAPEDLARFAELGIIAAMQPTHATSDMYWAERRVGPERIQGAYAWRTLLDSGAKLAFGSDFPVEQVDPRLGLFAAVSRQDLAGEPAGGWYADERVTRYEALRGFTLDAAYAGFMEKMVGSLEEGKRADFVVLDRDYMSIPVAEIPKLVVLETWLDGKQLYAAPEAP